MPSILSSATTVFCTLILLALPSSTHQYTYSCDVNAPCGCSSSPASVSRIVGGESAPSSTWGWAVSIAITISGGTSLCGGAILSSSWIITAAHCMASVTSASQVTIYAGSNTRYSGQSRVASSITVHPSYLSSTYENDIALIRLGTPLTMNSAVKTICIPSVSSATLAAGEWPPAGLSVVAVGWGTLSENGAVSSSLQQVTVQTMAYSSSMCSSVLHNRQLQFCAGVLGGGKDTCQGDSGGPLMMYTTSQQWILVGVTSYGVGCARANYAGVYTRIAAYQSWIATVTGNAYTSATSSNSANINPLSSNGSSTTEQTTRIASTTTNRPSVSSTMKTASVSHLLFLLSFLFFILFYSF